MSLNSKEIKNNIELTITEPFKNDCDSCEYFYSFPVIYPSGKCIKHDISCGCGVVCKDYKIRT